MNTKEEDILKILCSDVTLKQWKTILSRNHDLYSTLSQEKFNVERFIVCMNNFVTIPMSDKTRYLRVVILRTSNQNLFFLILMENVRII